MDQVDFSQTDADSVPSPMAGLADEFLDRYRRGERPALSDYARRHPHLADEIRDLFPALVMLEDARPVPPRPGASPFESVRSGRPPHRLGEYRIVREIGRGGMGIVYEAEQESLGRRVALKVLPHGKLENARQVERFRREARAAARLHHTNIVPVFGVGEENGTHYYVMQHIDGRPLDDVLEHLRRLRGEAANDRIGAPNPGSRIEPNGSPDELALQSNGLASSMDLARSLWEGSFREPIRSDSLSSSDFEKRDSSSGGTRLDIRPSTEGRDLTLSGASSGSSDPHWPYARSVANVGVQVADALEYSMGQGVLHRDVKPSNLLLDVFGTVWLTDFGLAKATDTPDLTHTGDLFGTLRYLAPERFKGRADVRSDVYALGLTLYELLAMRPAFDHAQADLVGQIALGKLRRLDEVNPALSRDLITIVHKAIARDPGDRYQTPGAMAEDLRRFLDDRPIAARRLGPLEKSWRWCRHNPIDAILAATIVALLSVAIGMGLWVQRQHAERRAEAADREGRARQALETALDQATSLLHEGRWPEAKAVLRPAGGWLEDGHSLRLERRLKRLQADLDIVDKLEENRMSREGLFRSRADLRSVARGYETAFAEAGLAVAGDRAAADVRDSAIRDELVAALDDWALVTSDLMLRSQLLRTARLADPDPVWRDRVRDPAVWGDRRALESLASEAIAVLGDVSPPQLLTTLGVLLKQNGGDPEALLRAAQRLRPADLWFNFELGNLLRDLKPEEAVGFSRAALVIRPRGSKVHNNLGNAMAAAGRDQDAIACYRKAIELDPKNSSACNNLGSVYWKLGRIAEATAFYRKATEIDPRSSAAHHNLGNTHFAAGRVDEAIAAYRRSIELNPAEAALAEKLLGGVLLGQGRLHEARATLEDCLKLLAANHSMRTSAQASLDLCDRLLALEDRLPALLQGRVRPADALVWRDLALYSQHARNWPAAARFFAAAFAARPDLARNLQTFDRYNAACFAALAGCNQTHNQTLSTSEQADFRRQAREWLMADLARWTQEAATNRQRVYENVRLWKTDVDLNGIRDPAPLLNLPEHERLEWKAFWAEVDSLLAQAAFVQRR